MTDDDLVTLDECPEGLFMFGEHYGFMTEYSTTAVDSATGNVVRQRDAYVVDSGEYFWGGVSTAAERAKLLVKPIDIDAIKAAARAEALEEAAKAAEKYAPFRGYCPAKNSDYGWATARERIAETIRAIAKATE